MYADWVFSNMFLCCTFIVGPTMCFPATHIYNPQNKRDVRVYIHYIGQYMVFSVLARFGPIEDST